MDVLEIIEEVIHDEAAELRRENEQLKQELYRLHAELSDAYVELSLTMDKLEEEKERHLRFEGHLARHYDSQVDSRDSEIRRLKYTIRLLSEGKCIL